jgi:hypothetical protein
MQFEESRGTEWHRNKTCRVRGFEPHQRGGTAGVVCIFESFVHLLGAFGLTVPQSILLGADEVLE